MSTLSLQANSSNLHRKASSNVNLSSIDTTDSSQNNNTGQKPVINHGKPNLAPKPPILNGIVFNIILLLES